MDRAFLAGLAQRLLDATYKSLPIPTGASLRAADVAARRWDVRAGDLDFPAMVLKESAMQANLELMAYYCRRHGVSHAPHGKTTMAPQLFERQLDAGAWGITAANAAQCRAYRAFGVQRILLANELVDDSALRWLAAELDADPELDFLCYVDSIAGVSAIDGAFAAVGCRRPLGVLLEVGYLGGRSGCRTVEEAHLVAERVATSPWLELRGVAGFEGLIPGADVEEVMAKSTAYLSRMRQLVESLDESSLLPDGEIVVSAGGSSYFDLVVAELGPERFERPVRTVLRSGCYVTHDVMMFELRSPFGARATEPASRLQPALELWATVWSRPEPGLAILGFGKRDAPYDYGLPVAQSVYTPGALEPRGVEGAFRVIALNDQHAFLSVPVDDPLSVGDRVVLGISHPCTAFDKWRYLPIVDDEYVVTDGVFTFF